MLNFFYLMTIISLEIIKSDARIQVATKQEQKLHNNDECAISCGIHRFIPFIRIVCTKQSCHDAINSHSKQFTLPMCSLYLSLSVLWLWLQQHFRNLCQQNHHGTASFYSVINLSHKSCPFKVIFIHLISPRILPLNSIKLTL